MEFILHNGQMVHSRDFNPADLWLDQGFTVTEEMWFANGEIQFFDAHISRIAQIFSLFEKELPVGLPPWTELLRLFKRLINKNKAFMAGWLILKISINIESAGYIAFIRTFPNRSFPLDHEGKLCLFSPFQKLSTVAGKQFPFSSEWIRNAEYFRLGGDNNSISVILNEKGLVTESTAGNIFYIVKNSLFTPSPGCGCFLDLMRGKVIEAAQECGFQTMESDKTTPPALYEAEEIFTVSEREGFKWIRGIESKRYMKTKSHLVWRQINKRWFPEVS